MYCFICSFYAAQVFPDKHIVYLTPDSPNPLTTLAADDVYVIGGLVDESIIRGLTFGAASTASIRTARLPIAEHAEACPGTHFSQVLV